MMSVKQHYHQAVYNIMETWGIPRGKVHYVLPANATFADAVQYTEYHVGYQSREEEYGSWRVDSHYRYNSYRPVLNHRLASERRQAHVDIGCGAGVFSWAFLDWAVSNGIAYNRVDLYGFDRCQAMIDLAGAMRGEMVQVITNYPELWYSYNVNTILGQLSNNHHKGTDYTITFGHVLVQSHNPVDIQIFTQIIKHIIGLMDQQSNCVLIAVDANGQSGTFAVAWDKLDANLQLAGIRLGNAIKVGPSAKLVQLYPSIH